MSVPPGGRHLSVLLTLRDSLDSVFLALALRFDYYLARGRSPTPLRPRANFAKPYFMACFFAYILGQELPLFAVVRPPRADLPSASQASA